MAVLKMPSFYSEFRSGKVKIKTGPVNVSIPYFGNCYTGEVFQINAKYQQNLLSVRRQFSSIVISEREGTKISKLTHVQEEDGKLKMVDVSNKSPTIRTAMAEAHVMLGATVYELVQQNKMKKGDVLMVARLAGIMAAKKTSDIIPLCHNINISIVDIKTYFVPETHEIVLQSYVKTTDQTGVEMEALMAVSVAALTVYDMCKSASKDIIISNVQLLSKTGGKEDFHRVI